MLAWFGSCSLEAALLLAASWVGASLFRRGSAAARHQLWALGVAGALLLPLLAWVVPSVAPEMPAIAFEAPAIFVTAGRATTAATGAAPTWPTWLAILWAAGSVVIASRFARGHLAARRLVQSSVDASWSASLHEAAASLDLDTRVRLLRSDAIRSPMTIVVFRPRVLLPAAADDWSPARLRAVLVHELGHIRRRDTLVQLAAQLACALYWWNPLAWLAAARLRIEREHACDDLVLDAGILPSHYAADLLDLARSISIDPSHGAICMVDRSGTEARLHHILDASASRRPLGTRVRLTVTLFALASVVVLACTSSRAPSVEPAAPRGTLSVGSPFVREPTMFQAPTLLDVTAPHLARVQAEVKRRLGTLEQCYERRLAADPALAGTIVIHWVITPSGKVADQCITEDSVGDHALVACVNELVQAGDFPAPPVGSVDVSFPFVFAPRATVAGN